MICGIVRDSFAGPDHVGKHLIRGELPVDGFAVCVRCNAGPEDNAVGQRVAACHTMLELFREPGRADRFISLCFVCGAGASSASYCHERERLTTVHSFCHLIPH